EVPFWENSHPSAPGDLILKNKSPGPVGNPNFEKIVSPRRRATILVPARFPARFSGFPGLWRASRVIFLLPGALGSLRGAGRREIRRGLLSHAPEGFGG